MTQKNRPNKRPKYIENQLKEINDNLRNRRLKYDDHYDDPLFQWFTSYLLEHNWYLGFNMYYDFVNDNGNVVSILAGPDYESRDYYIQIW